VSNTPEVNTPATADIAIFLMLGALRQAHISMETVRAGQWQGSAMPLGHDPQGKILGILGMGSIGQAVANRARAFGMRIQYHNRRRLPASDERAIGATYVDFETLIMTSDVLSLNCKLTAATRHMIGAKELNQLKKGAVLVNTARGGLIDEKALVEVLNSGHIGCVGLDVFEEEPKIAEGLKDHPRAFIVPHIGTATFETQVRLTRSLRSDSDNLKLIQSQRAAEMLALDNLKSVTTDARLLTRISEQENMTRL
jgi:glyoxylate reductase